MAGHRGGPLEDKQSTRPEAAVAATAFLWDRDETGRLSLATTVSLLRSGMMAERGQKDGLEESPVVGGCRETSGKLHQSVHSN